MSHIIFAKEESYKPRSANISVLHGLVVALENAEGSWLGKGHPSPLSPYMGLGVWWRFLTEVCHLDLDLDIVTGLWYNHGPNCGSLSWFGSCKELTCPLSLDLGVWRMLEVSGWDLESWSSVGFDHWCLVNPCSNFWLFILIIKVQRTSMFLKSWFWTTMEVSDWGSFGI